MNRVNLNLIHLNFGLEKAKQNEIKYKLIIIYHFYKIKMLTNNKTYKRVHTI